MFLTSSIDSNDGNQLRNEDFFVNTIYFDIFGVLYIIIVPFLYYSGFWFDITVMTDKSQVKGELEIAYKYGRGRSEAKMFLASLRRQFPVAKLIQIFYNEHDSIQDQDIRWAVGIIVVIDGKSVIDTEAQKLVSMGGYHCIRLPEIERAIVTEFPDTTFLSTFLQRRAHSYLRNFEKEFKMIVKPHIEFVYNQNIYYCRPLEQHDRFVVAEELEKND